MLNKLDATKEQEIPIVEDTPKVFNSTALRLDIYGLFDNIETNIKNAKLLSLKLLEEVVSNGNKKNKSK